MAGFGERFKDFSLFEKLDIQFLVYQIKESEYRLEELRKKLNPKERQQAEKVYKLLMRVDIEKAGSFKQLDAHLKQNPIDAKTLLHVCDLSIGSVLSDQNSENAKNPRKVFQTKEEILAFRDKWIDEYEREHGIRKENGWRKAYKKEHEICYKKLNEIIEK